MCVCVFMCNIEKCMGLLVCYALLNMILSIEEIFLRLVSDLHIVVAAFRYS